MRTAPFGVITMTALLALAFAAPAGAVELPSPALEQLDTVAAMRGNDAEAFLVLASGKSRETLAAEWDEFRAGTDPTTFSGEDANRAWTLLATPEGTVTFVDGTLPPFADWGEAKIRHYEARLPIVLQHIAGSDRFTAIDVEQLSQVALAARRWSEGIDWRDRARFEVAASALSGFVRRSGLVSPDDVLLMSWDELMPLADDAMATTKQLLLAYDLDLDRALSTSRSEVLSRDGNRAVLLHSIEIFGVPTTSRTELEYRDGRWHEVERGEAE